MTPANVQLMDLENYDMMDVEIPTDEDIAGALEAGKEVEYWIIMDRIKIQRVKK
jgi:translation initiation factor 5A